MESVQDLLNFMLWDRRLILLPDARVLVILNPTVADRNIAALEKRLCTQQAIESETPTEAELLANAREGGLWTDEDDLVIKEGESHIAFLESEKAKQKFLTKKNKIQEQIEKTKEKLQSTLDKKQGFYVLTAEYMANEAFVLTLLKRLILNEDGTPFFSRSNTISYVKESDPLALNILIREIVSEGMLPHVDIRRVARSVEWRMLWTLNRENIQSLFNTPVANLSINQRGLIYWSRVYDLAYESTEKPDEEVIQDDARFDAWLQNRNSEKDENKQQRKGVPDHHERGQIIDGYYIETCTCGVKDMKVKGHGERPPHMSDCQYGTYRKYTREEKNKIADEIYAKNAPRIQQLQRQEQNKVADVGLIDEKNLRGQKSRMILGSKQETHRINR